MPLRFLSPIHRATRQLSIHLEGRGSKLGISPEQGHLLTYLLSYGPCPIGEFHRVFGYKRSTLTSMLDRMVERGWIERHLLPTDRRSFNIELTDRGRRLARQVRQDLEALEEEIMQRLEPEALAGFQTVMQAIADVTGITVRPVKKESS